MGNKSVLTIVVVLVIGLVGAGLLLNSQRADEQLGNEEIEPVVDTGEPDPAADVVVTLEEFGDYQSSACADLNSTLKELKEEYAANLNLVFRNLPLTNINKNALPAAQAAEAARMQNRFWEMHDLLYEKQNEWKDEADPRPRFLKFAQDLGLDVERFTKDVDGEQVQFRIEADKDAALAQGIQETPTLLINGRRLKTDAVNADGIREGIEVMLTRGSVESPE